ncbi:MAG TPA: CHASE2 domain-containing protein [Kofleriaceae bacterium]|nr:CHASE2 domain-containing protein [Kofleriaceae bacterium]
MRSSWSRIARNAPVLVAAVATAACALCHAAHSSGAITVPGLDGLERATYDIRAQLRRSRRPRTADLVIVDTAQARAALDSHDGWAALIDAIADREPLAIAILAPLPYPERHLSPKIATQVHQARAALAALPTRTTAGESALAALAAVEGAVDSDVRLAHSVAAAGNVHLGTAAVMRATGPAGKLKIEPAALRTARLGDAGEVSAHERPYRAQSISATIDPVARKAHAGGFSTFITDPDGVTRRAPAAIVAGDGLYMSLAMSLALARIGPRAEASFAAADRFLALPGTQVPLADHSTVLISYLGPAGTFPRVDAAALLAGEGPPVTLAGKLVIVSDPRGRRLQTPLGPMSEAEVTATYVHNLLFDEALTTASPLVTLLIIALLGAGLTTLAARHRWRWIAPAAVWSALGYALIAHIFYVGFGLVLEVAAPVIAAAVIAAAPLVTRRVLNRQGAP